MFNPRNWGCSPSKWLKWLVNGGLYQVLTGPGMTPQVQLQPAKPPGRTDTILLETRGHLRWRLRSSDEFTYDLRQRNRDLMEIAGNVPQHPKGWEDMYVGREGV